MNIIKKSALLLGVSLICATSAHAGWQEMKESFWKRYFFTSGKIWDAIEDKMGITAAESFGYVNRLVYNYPERTLAVFLGTTAVVVGSVMAYKKYTAKKAQATKQKKQSAEQQEEQNTVVE